MKLFKKSRCFTFYLFLLIIEVVCPLGGFKCLQPTYHKTTTHNWNIMPIRLVRVFATNNSQKFITKKKMQLSTSLVVLHKINYIFVIILEFTPFNTTSLLIFFKQIEIYNEVFIFWNHSICNIKVFLNGFKPTCEFKFRII